MGSRGPGETKIELDRRRIRTRMAKLRREIKDDEAGARHQARRAARRTRCPAVAIAGYTNAGKSSLLNRLTDAGVLVENALFATLDPTVRRAETADGRLYTLADTVGLRPLAAHPAGRGVPLHAGGGRRRRPAPARRRRLAPRPGGPDRRGPRGARARSDAADVPEIIVSTRPTPPTPRSSTGCARARPHCVVVSARTGAGLDELRR